MTVSHTNVWVWLYCSANEKVCIWNILIFELGMFLSIFHVVSSCEKTLDLYLISWWIKTGWIKISVLSLSAIIVCVCLSKTSSSASVYYFLVDIMYKMHIGLKAKTEDSICLRPTEASVTEENIISIFHALLWQRRDKKKNIYSLVK